MSLRLQIERGVIAGEASAAPPLSRPASVRFINPLPQEIGGRYIGQAEKQAAIQAAIIGGARLVSVYGRGGIGKTALVCKVLTDLQPQPDRAPLAGIVSLSALTAGIRLDRILIDLGRLLPSAAADLLHVVAQDAQASTAQKINVLLEQTRGSRYLLFLDNLETLQDPTTGALIDPELQTFFETVLAQSDSLCLLVTSREPLGLPRSVKTWERAIPLDQGLLPEEAASLLRAFDPTGAAGLRDAPAPQLRRIAERTHGFPRALEAVAGLLLESPLLRPDDLFDDLTLWAQEVTPAIVQQAVSRLDPQAARVLQALALFGSPVSRAALEFLLSSTLAPADLTPLLSRLVRAFFVRFDRVTREFALHPIDQDYCYGQIPDDDATFGRRQLHQRAAQFFRHQRKPQAAWLTVDDLSAPLAEFGHLVQAGEYSAAAGVLRLVDRDYLWEWGQRARLKALHGRLQGHLADPRQARASCRRLAWTDWPDISIVAPLFEANLADARRHQDRAGEADALDDLAQVRRFQADWSAAELHEQALAIYRDLGDQRGEGDALGGAAAAYFGLGQVERAIAYNQQAIRIHRELNNQPSLGFALWSLGGNLAYIGQFEQAIACHNTAIGVYQEINAPRGIALHLWSRAFCNVRLGRYVLALEDLSEAGGLYDALQDHEGIQSVQMGRGVVLAQQGASSEAVAVLQSVLASGIRNRIILAFSTYALVQALLAAGQLTEARSLLSSASVSPLKVLAISMIVIDGIIWARLAQSGQARASFSKALADAEPFLQRPGRYQFLFLCGLARAGLALTDDAEVWLDGALADITTALNECAAAGLVSQHRQLLETLMACPESSRLEPIRHLMAAAAP